MIIDCHVHIKGGDVFRREYTGEYIIQRMKEAGVDKSVVFSICLPSKEANEMTYKEVKKFPDRLIGFAYALPSYNSIVTEELERAIKEFGFKGIKIHGGEATLDQSTLYPVIEKAIELDVPCLIDCVNRFKWGPTDMRDLANTYPDAKIIIAHFGVPSGNELAMNQFIELARDKKNVFLDTSYVRASWKIEEAIKKAGPEKIIFGSDGPLIHPLIALTKIKVLNLKKEIEEMILYKNIARLIKIKV